MNGEGGKKMGERGCTVNIAEKMIGKKEKLEKKG